MLQSTTRATGPSHAIRRLPRLRYGLMKDPGHRDFWLALLAGALGIAGLATLLIALPSTAVAGDAGAQASRLGNRPHDAAGERARPLPRAG